MPRLYRTLKVNRVDLVDAGANPGAHIALAKRHDLNPEPRMAKDNEGTPPVDADVAKRLAEAETTNVALAKRVEEIEARATVAETELSKALDKQELAEAEAVAKGLTLPNITDKAAFIRTAKRALGDEWPKMEAVLKAYEAQVAAGELFSEKGSDSSVAAEAGYGRLEQMADKLVTDGIAKTHADGVAKAMQTAEGKRAYGEYITNLKGRA